MKKTVLFTTSVKPSFLFFEDKVIIQHQIKVSKYIPDIIKLLLKLRTYI